MKKFITVLLAALSVISLSACSSTETTTTTTAPVTTTEAQVAAKNSSASSSSSSSSSYKKSSSSSSSFTNKFGTPTTKCAHSGCNRYIASSGDTNCCTTHSNRCLECRKYIDEDAMYCMSCLSGSSKKSSSSSSSYSSSSYSSSSYGSSSSSSHKCYICGSSASSGRKIGSYWYCSSCASLMSQFGY